MDQMNTNNSIEISDEVVGAIAGMAMADIEGVAGMASASGGVLELLSKKSVQKGIKVQIEGQIVSLETHILVNYGAKIPDVALAIEEKTKEAVESMTGMQVARVNVHVEGIHFPSEDKKKDLFKKKREEEKTKN